MQQLRVACEMVDLNTTQGIDLGLLRAFRTGKIAVLTPHLVTY